MVNDNEKRSSESRFRADRADTSQTRNASVLCGLRLSVRRRTDRQSARRACLSVTDTIPQSTDRQRHT